MEALEGKLYPFDLLHLLPKRDAEPDMVSIEAKQRKGIYIAEMEKSTVIWYAKESDRGKWASEKVLQMPFRIKAFDVEPNSRRAYAIREDNRVCYVASQEEQSSLFVTGDFLAVSPNGKFIAIGDWHVQSPMASIGVYELSANGSRRKFEVSFRGDTGKLTLARQFFWSSDSSELAFAEAIPWSGLLTLSSRLVALDIATGKKRVLGKDVPAGRLTAWLSEKPDLPLARLQLPRIEKSNHQAEPPGR